MLIFFCQAEDGIRDHCVTGVQTCALPICFRKCLDTHKESLFSEPKRARSRRQKWVIVAQQPNHNMVGLGVRAAPTCSGNNRRTTTILLVVSESFLAILFCAGRLAPVLCPKFKQKFRSKKYLAARPESPPAKNMTRRKSTSWKASKRSGNGPGCSLETQMSGGCTTSFTK